MHSIPQPADLLDSRRRRHDRSRRRPARSEAWRKPFDWWQIWVLVLSLVVAWFLLRVLQPWAIRLDDGQPKEPVTMHTGASDPKG